jgi:hypothetical protein
MIVSARSERMPVSAGSAGLRTDPVAAAFLGIGRNLAVRPPVDVGVLSSSNCIKTRSQSP